MRTYAVLEDTHEIADVEVPTPQPTGSEVLLRVLRAGVCHTDTHLREGYYDLGSRGHLSLADRGLKYPLVLGHEVVGVVTSIGPEAQGVKPGDVRLVFPWIGDESCEACQAGHENHCRAPRNIGVAQRGGYADHILVPDAKYLLDVDGLDLSWAATLACSGLTAYSAAKQALPVLPTSPVVVIGVGGVGLTAVATLRALGHEAIIAVDLQSENLDLARQLGASAVVRADDPSVRDGIKAAAGGPVAGAVDFVNNGMTASIGFDVLGKGGRMVQVGLFGGEFVIPTTLLTLNSISVVGSFVGTLADLRELIELAKGGSLPRIPLIPGELGASAIAHSLDRLAAGRVPGRIVLEAAGLG